MPVNVPSVDDTTPNLARRSLAPSRDSVASTNGWIATMGDSASLAHHPGQGRPRFYTRVTVEIAASSSTRRAQSEAELAPALSAAASIWARSSSVKRTLNVLPFALIGVFSVEATLGGEYLPGPVASAPYDFTICA